jgi:Transposase DDE domain/Transposase domain (DUF772)
MLAGLGRLGVQGVERQDRTLLDAAALVGHLVPEGSIFGFLATHRGQVFPDEQFADLFPSGRGRPSLPAPVAAAILTLQSLYDLSDAETAEAARCDLRWKVATGMALDDGGFHPSTLTYWRQRLARSARPHRINEAVKRVVEQTGILAGRRRRAVDSTILADAVATQDTVTQLIAAIRRVAREVPGAAAQIQAVCSGHDYTTPGKPQIDWEDPAAKEALVSALVNDANALVDALQDAELDERAQAAVALLALVAGQDVEPAEGSDGTDGRWRIARKVTEDRVISTVDPDARHTRKSPGESPGRLPGARGRRAGDRDHHRRGAHQGRRRRKLRPGRGRAVPGAQTTHAADNHGSTWEWYGDSAYGTGDLRDAIGKAGHVAVIKPKPLQAAVQGGFTVDDFTVDRHAGTVSCPGGHTRPISTTGVATFGALCRTCPLRQQCTTCKTGRKIVLHDHDALLRQARRDWAQDPGLREAYRRHRPNVERVISQLASRGGRRLKLRYLGTATNNAWLKRRTAALNLRNLIGRGLTRRDGTWALATT